MSFTPFISSYTFATLDCDLPLEDFQAELLSLEAVLDNQNHNFADTRYAFVATKSKIPNYPKKPRQLDMNLILDIQYNILPLVVIIEVLILVLSILLASNHGIGF